VKNVLSGIVALVFAGGIAGSCGGSTGAIGGDAAVSCGGSGERCCNTAACDNGLTCGAGTCSDSEAREGSVTDSASGSGGDVAVLDGAGSPPDPEAGPSMGDSGLADVADDASAGPCKSGEYKGPFAGNYTSHLTSIGIPIPVKGSVDVTLAVAGSAQATCMLAGEARPCNQLFSLQNGTITGVDDAINEGDASVGGFPYFCTMTGTLDCTNKKLVNGWLQCTYCIGAVTVADGGAACSLGNGVGGTSGVGGHFAGPMTASYEYGSVSFVTGTWNGSEALAGNDGGSPGPDGGPLSNYLSDSGVYLGAGQFGGSGTWSASPR
jgi:hypothetical protein